MSKTYIILYEDEKFASHTGDPILGVCEASNVDEAKKIGWWFGVYRDVIAYPCNLPVKDQRTTLCVNFVFRLIFEKLYFWVASRPDHFI